MVTSTNDHLLVLAILLDQTLVQFHALVLQFRASILLDLPLSLFVVLLRIRILECPCLRLIAFELASARLHLLAALGPMLILVLLGALFLSLVSFTFIFGVLPVMLPLLLCFLLGAECIVGALLDLLIDFFEHAVDHFLGWRRHRAIFALAWLQVILIY